MAVKVWKDRVKETTSTTGTGTLTLAGPAAQHQAFSAVGSGSLCEYTILSGDGVSWEVGEGTYTSAGNTLSRATVLDGSSGPGTLVNLAGISTVFLTSSARRASRGGLWQRALEAADSAVPTSANTGFNAWNNQASTTVADTDTGILIDAVGTGSDHASMRYLNTPPSPPYSFSILAVNNFIGRNFCGPLFGWWDGTKLHAMLNQLVNGTMVLAVYRFSSVTVAVSPDFTSPANTVGQLLWMRIRDDGTTVYFQICNDGGNFVTVYSVAKASGYLGSSGYSKPFFGAWISGASTPSAQFTIAAFKQGT